MKRALVTGGLTGIGAAASAALRDAGYDVIATGVADSDLERAPPGLAARRLDVTRQDEVDALAATLEGLDALVNCAGIALGSPAEQTMEGFARVLDVNLAGTMRMCLACRPLLEASGGCIVNVASILTLFGSGNAPAYSASKGGVGQLTKSLAIAWAPGIRVNAIAPGWVETALTAPVRTRAERSDAILARTPMARWGRPEDIAGPIAFLCSPQAAFVTGAILPVDGGYAAM